MTTQAWEPRQEYNLDLARMIRACLRHEQALLPRHKWITFPDSSCSFTFGKPGRLIPIGTLLLLWKVHPDVTTDCASCGGRVYGYEFGGLFSIGGAIARCSACGQKHVKSIGGAGAVGSFIGPSLKRTEYRINGMTIGGFPSGAREPLWSVLSQLGEQDLPNRSWATGEDPTPAPGLSIKGRPLRLNVDVGNG